MQQTMQFEKTQTFQNLARSFAGESQAGMRYQMTATLAMQEGHKTLSDTIRTIAKNETYHARQFFEKILEKAGSQPNIQLDAGYPFHGGSLLDGLKFAAEDEKSEATDIYPAFAKIAKEEGFLDVAALFKLVAEVEKRHRIVFEYLYEGIKNGTLYKSSDSAMVWICSNCGHMHVGEEAFKICPLCKAEQGYAELHLPYEGVKS